MAIISDDEKSKIVYLLGKRYEGRPKSKMLSEIVNHSTFVFNDHWNQRSIDFLYNIEIHVDPEVFLKYVEFKKGLRAIFKNDILEISRIRIDKLNILPDYKNLQIIDSTIKPVYTIWEDINHSQQILFSQLEKDEASIDLQNIGNSSRLILQKLAEHVFDPSLHKPTDPSIDTSKGSFKNRLHSYISYTLSGKENKEFRSFANSAIETVERSIDLANNLTHKLNPKRVIAEVCVIGTISAISIIKLVHSMDS